MTSSKTEEFSEDKLKTMNTIDVFPIPQKDGKVMDGGDCGYCCLAGICGYENTLAAYEAVEGAMPEGNWKERESMYPLRIRMFFEANNITYEEYNPPFDHYKEGMMTYPWNNHNWYRFFKYLIESDKILYSSVRYDRRAPAPPRSHVDNDHMVIINGYREWWKPHPTLNSASLQCEVRVSCSASGNRWQEWSDLLYWHGCAGIVVDMEEIEYLKERMKGEQ